MEISGHARAELLILAALVLGSCGSNAPRTFTAGDDERIDIADVNARNALNRINSLEARVEELEAKLGQ